MRSTRYLTFVTTALLLSAGSVAGGPLASADPEVAEVSPQVVNGVPGPSEDFGFLVALGDRDSYQALGMYRAQRCGGTLASPTLVITAAHCVDDSRARDIVVGSFPDGDLASEAGTVVDVAAIRVHPRYDSVSQKRDIAVLTLTEPLLDVATLTPVTKEEAPTLVTSGAPASVAGWGAINHRYPWRSTSTYRIGDLIVFPTSACGEGGTFTIDGITFRGYGPGSLDARYMLCAEGVRGGAPVDSCVGDSGGPLAAGVGDARRLIGVVSWGLDECATRLGPGVYTRVSAFSRFLMRAGVPFTPDPVDRPFAPRITRVSVSASTIKVTLTPASGGLAPEQFVVSARDPDGQVTSCSVPARPRPQEAGCTISDLSPGVPYAVSAISITGLVQSTPSAERTVTPAGLPATPRIASVELDRGGFAGFVVTGISGNGSPVVRKEVRCTSRDYPSRTAPIVARGIALVSGLTQGSTYTCTAIVANEFGTAKSEKVRVKAL